MQREGVSEQFNAIFFNVFLGEFQSSVGDAGAWFWFSNCHVKIGI